VRVPVAAMKKDRTLAALASEYQNSGYVARHIT